MKGKGSLTHNRRDFVADNVDPERVEKNIVYCNESLRAVYHELFDEAVEKYNAKQKRKDRRIEDYYEKVRTSKQEKLFHEVIMQIGNRENMGAVTDNGELIDFVPYVSGWKGKGMETKVSMKQALASLGFTGGSKGDTEYNQWIDGEKEQLAAVMARHGIEWEKKGTHEKHLSVLDFKKQERAKEVAQLEEKCAEFRGELGQIQEQITLAGAEMEPLQEDTQEAREEALKAAKQVERQQKRLNKLAPAVKNMERLAVQFSSNPDEVLPDAGKVESGKS